MEGFSVWSDSAAACAALLIAGLQAQALAHGAASTAAMADFSHPLLGCIGLQLPALELQPLPLSRISGVLVSAGVMLHAVLHVHEAPADASSLSWWAGALFGSVLVCGGTCLLLRLLPVAVARWSAAALMLLGAGLAV